jgi:hypothetical protein
MISKQSLGAQTFQIAKLTQSVRWPWANPRLANLGRKALAKTETTEDSLPDRMIGRRQESRRGCRLPGPAAGASSCVNVTIRRLVLAQEDERSHESSTLLMLVKIGIEFINAAAGFGSRVPNGKIRARGTYGRQSIPSYGPGAALLETQDRRRKIRDAPALRRKIVLITI